jgi:large subunit ribosomal protein L23
MPLFGIRKSKENQQNQAQSTAGDAKMAASKAKSKKAPNISANKAVASAPKNEIAMPKGTFGSATDMIVRPHITEKSGVMSQNGIYTFQVSRKANKPSIAKAVKELYKVTPVKVSVINIPSKKVFIRGKMGSVPGIRKALVTLRKGDKIDFV